MHPGRGTKKGSSSTSLATICLGVASSKPCSSPLFSKGSHRFTWKYALGNGTRDRWLTQNPLLFFGRDDPVDI